MAPNLLTPDLAAFIEATNEYFSRHRQSKRTASRCPMLALSGHGDRAQRCPLSGVKRTWIKRLVMSASDPKRTFDS